MLLVLMYHQILNIEEPLKSSIFKEHLKYLYNNYPIILPGDPLLKDSLNICLTFDDAYFDFYHYVFPELQKLKIHAVIGVPTKFIQDSTTTDSKDRLSVKYPYRLDIKYKNNSPLCTWQEIIEMHKSGFIKIASHSHNHVALTSKQTNLTTELQLSKDILEQKLQTNIDTFIYPFGKTSRTINHAAKQYYKYIMRIGSALNMDWNEKNSLIYRINADLLWKNNKPITKNFLMKARFKYLLNYIRYK